MNPKIVASIPVVSQIIAALGLHSDDAFFVENLEERIELIIHKLKFFPDKPKVACICGLSPMMGSGKLVAELVETAGGKPALSPIGLDLEALHWEQIIAEDPEIIIVMPTGFTIAQTLQNMDKLLGLPGWKDIAAVKNNRVYIADASCYFNPDSLIVDSLEILAEIINPKYLNYGYQGTAWIKFEC